MTYVFEEVCAQDEAEVGGQVSQSQEFVAVQEALDGHKVEVDECQDCQQILHVAALEHGGCAIGYSQ